MSDYPLLDQAATLFIHITERLNSIIVQCRADNSFDDPLLQAQRTRLEHIRRRAYHRWYRRGGALHAPSEEVYDYE
jgi:hypothetical protein